MAISRHDATPSDQVKLIHHLRGRNRGMNVLDKWFGYRKATPDGKRSSPLDDIHVSQWPSAWVKELLELCSLLRRLVELEPAQADLLVRILDAPVVTVRDLERAGVLPVKDRDRKPHRSVSSGPPGEAGIFGDGAAD